MGSLEEALWRVSLLSLLSVCGWPCAVKEPLFPMASRFR